MFLIEKGQRLRTFSRKFISNSYDVRDFHNKINDFTRKFLSIREFLTTVDDVPTFVSKGVSLGITLNL